MSAAKSEVYFYPTLLLLSDPFRGVDRDPLFFLFIQIH